MAAFIGPLIGAAGSLFGGLFGSNAASNAAGDVLAKGNAVGQSIDKATGGAIQAGYAGINQANQALTGGLGQARTDITGGVGASNALLTNVLGSQLNTLSPYLQAGGKGLDLLAAFAGPGGAGSTPFSASMMEQQDPGYQFRLAQGAKALEAGAAARGGVLGGGEQKALARYSQDYASNEYNSAFQRYMEQQRQQYGMLAGLAGIGQQATGEAVNTLGAYVGRAGGNLMTGGTTLGTASLGVGNALANTAMQGNQYVGNIGLEGANLAGNAYMGGTLGNAALNVAGANQLGQGVASAAGILGAGANDYWNPPPVVSGNVGDYGTPPLGDWWNWGSGGSTP